jgi:L,D-peptidoglycan transpeptidase YkuD (ErfK/YbiS/YcfS/YnhG family)
MELESYLTPDRMGRSLRGGAAARVIFRRGLAYFVLGTAIIWIAIAFVRPVRLHATMTASAAPPPTASPVPTNSRQLILVTAESWKSSVGSLNRFVRDSPSSHWRQVGAPIPVMLGRGGMGWGRGLQAEAIEGPSKVEGDGKSPAGVFTLGTLFGYEAPPKPDFRMGYIRLRESTRCIEDVRSKHYNQIVDAAAISPDWAAADHMFRTDELYRLGVFVNANPEPVAAGRGSCIFLHVWRGEEMPTVGCTAMDLSRLRALARWLDADKDPVLVQLPMAEYTKLKHPWRLP